MASTTTRPSPAGGTTSNTDCSACGASAPRPQLTCFECIEGVDIHGNVDSIQYCTARCRDVAAAEHKGDCEKRNIRKQIYRAGELLQSSFYRFRELNFMEKITWTKEKGGVMSYSQVPLDRRTTVFETSPYKVISNVNYAHALMSFNQCNTQLSMQFEFSKKLLRGIAKYIEEVALDVDNALLKVRQVFFNGEVFEPTSSHQALCVETDDGEAYFFDITGAQFGQYKAVQPLQTALDYYGNKVLLVWPHGHYRAKMPGDIKEQLTDGTGANPRDRIIPMVLGSIFDKHLGNWEMAHTDTVSSSLSSVQPIFERFRSTIHDLVLKASMDGRPMLRKAAPVALVPSLEVSADVQDNMNKPVCAILSNHHTGSQIGKVCNWWMIEQVKVNQPERWESQLGPILARGGVIPLRPENYYRKPSAVAKGRRTLAGHGAAHVLNTWESYWAHKKLDS